MVAHLPPTDTGRVGPGLGRDELTTHYRAYRRRQALALVHLIPREAIRPLVRTARSEGFDEGDRDSLEMLVAYCETLLPLPPQSVWAEDLAAHPDAHLQDLDASPEPPTAATPSTVEVRAFEYAGAPWTARLNLFREGLAWRGFIAFEEVHSGRLHRTALIFREEHPTTLRMRFLDFENASLEAFLRSALP